MTSVQLTLNSVKGLQSYCGSNSPLGSLHHLLTSKGTKSLPLKAQELCFFEPHLKRGQQCCSVYWNMHLSVPAQAVWSQLMQVQSLVQSATSKKFLLVADRVQTFHVKDRTVLIQATGRDTVCHSHLLSWLRRVLTVVQYGEAQAKTSKVSPKFVAFLLGFFIIWPPWQTSVLKSKSRS